MKRNKKILDITQDSLNTLKDEDFKRKLLLEQEALIEERAHEKAKNKFFKFAFNFRTLASTITCLALISIIVCVGIFVPKTGKPDDDGKSYFDEEKIVQDIEAQELQDIFKNYNLDEDNITSPTVAKGVSSGKILYYYFDYNTEFASCKVNIVVNSQYIFKEKETTGKAFVNDIALDILSSYVIEDGIYIHNVYGKTVIEGFRVYFEEFNSMSLTEDSGFEQFVADLFGIAY